MDFLSSFWSTLWRQKYNGDTYMDERTLHYHGFHSEWMAKEILQPSAVCPRAVKST